MEKIGARSVRYEVSMLPCGEDQVIAVGGYTHVFVNRSSNRPVRIPTNLREILAKLIEIKRG